MCQVLNGVKSVGTCLTQPGGLQLLVSVFGVLLLEDRGGCCEKCILVSLYLVSIVPLGRGCFLAQLQCLFLAFVLASATPPSSVSP